MFGAELLLVMVDLHFEHFKGLKQFLHFSFTVRAIYRILELLLGLLGKVDRITSYLEVVQEKLRIAGSTLFFPMLHLFWREVSNDLDTYSDFAQKLPTTNHIFVQCSFTTAVTADIHFSVFHEDVDQRFFEG